MHKMALARLTGASVDEIRYMEKKGFIAPSLVPLKNRQVRHYSDSDVRKVTLIIKYRRQGFTWVVAFQKTTRELASPSLFDSVPLSE